MRITKDITPIFFKKSKAVKKTKHQHPDVQVENVEYLHILKPSLDSFIHSYHPLDLSIFDLSIRFFMFLQNLFSFDFLQSKKEEIVIKKISKKNKKGKEQ